MKSEGQKRNRWEWRSLPVLAAALLPVFAFAVDRSNDSYHLRDEVNVGGEFFQTGIGIKLHGSVGTIESTLLSNDDFQMAPGPQMSFYYPTTITDLDVSTDTATTLLLGWTAPAAGVEYAESVSSYEIRYSQSPINENNFELASFGLSVEGKPIGFEHQNVQLNDLAYDTEYYVGIASLDNDDPKNKSFAGANPNPVRTLANPPIFKSFDVVDDRDRIIKLHFSPENDNPGHQLSFEGVISTESGFPEQLNVENSKTETLELVSDNEEKTISFDKILKLDHGELKEKKISTGVSYYIFLRALNGGGAPSEWVYCGETIINKYLPNDVSIANLASSAFTVNWTKRSNSYYYQVFIDVNDQFDSDQITILPNPSASIGSQNFSSLLANTTYYYKVRVWDWWGKWVNGVEIGDTLTWRVVTHVAPPIGVTAVDEVFQTSATVKWTESPDNDSGPHSYVVTLSTTSSFQNPVATSPPVVYSGSETMEFEFSGLKPNTPHYVRIIGKNRAGEESTGDDIFNSENPIFYTKPNVPLVNLVTPDYPTHQVGLTVQTNDNDPETNYEAKLYASPNCTEPMLLPAVQIDPGSVSSFPVLFQDLTGNSLIPANAEYSACVTALKADPTGGAHGVSDPLVNFTKPLKPQLTQPFFSSDTIRVTWSDTLGLAKNVAATYYQLDWRLEGALNPIDTLTIDGSGPLELSATGLTPNTTYQLTLTASTPTGSGWLSPSETRIEVTLATTPVRGAYIVYTNSATLEWETNGNPPGTQYELQLADNVGFNSPETPSQQGATSAEFTGLTPNTTYYARGRAWNHALKPTDDWVMWDEKATFAKKPVAQWATVGENDLQVRWNNSNANPENTSYTVTISTMANMAPLLEPPVTVIQNNDGSNLVHSFGSLIANKNHYVQVVANGHNQMDVSSEIFPGRTNATRVTGVDLTPTPGSEVNRVSFSWDATLNDPETRYEVELSLDNFSTVLESGTTGAGDGSYLFASDLLSNQRYYARVQPEGSGAFSEVVNTDTWPSIPEPVEPLAVNPVEETHHIRFGWPHGNNVPTHTDYEIKLSTSDGSTYYSLKTVSTGLGLDSYEFSDGDGVLANERYFVEVRALAKDGNPAHHSPWSNKASTFTAVLAPQGLSVTAETTETLTVGWTGRSGSVQNAIGTQYEVKWSSGGGSVFSIPLLSGVDSYSEILGAGTRLIPNTTYTIEVTAKKAVEGWSDVTSSIKGVTLAAVPGVETFNLYTDSAAVTWIPNGNPDGTVYEAKIALDGGLPDLSGVNTEIGVGIATFTALRPNTTYYVGVRAINHEGIDTDWSKAGPFATYAAKSVATWATVGETDLQVRWNNSNANPENTSYTVTISTMANMAPLLEPPVTVIQNNDGSNLVHSFGSLIANKNHYVQVVANGHNQMDVSSDILLGRTNATRVTGVDLTPTPGSEVNRVSLFWDATLNGPETRYEVELSSNDFASVLETGTTGAGDGSYLFASDLLSNQRYYARVQPEGSGAFSAVVNTDTWPSIPDPVKPLTVNSGEETHHVRFGWPHGNNVPTHTDYEIKLSTSDGSTYYSLKTVSTGLGLDSYEFSDGDGVLANERYFVEVRALAKDGNPAHHSLWSNMASTFTAVLAPQAPEVEESSNTLTVSWADSVGGVENTTETSYSLEWKEEAESDWAEPLTIEGNSDLSLAAEFLNPNTTYNLRLTALPAPGSLWPSEPWEGTTVTLATVPVGGLFEVFTDSATVVWEGNGNPGDTTYELKMSLNEGFSNPGPFDPRNYEEGIHAATFTALTPNTTYWVRAWGKNRAGITTSGWKEWGPQATDAAVAEVREYTLWESSGVVKWDRNGNPPGTTYQVLLTTMADDSSHLLAGYPQTVIQNNEANNLRVELPNLIPNKRYFMRVDALGHNEKLVSSISMNNVTSVAQVSGVRLAPHPGDPTQWMMLTWNQSLNSVETIYDVELSTDSAFPEGVTTTGSTVEGGQGSYEFKGEGFQSNQLFYARVKGQGGVFSIHDSTYTHPSNPIGMSGTTDGLSDTTRQVAFSWAHGNNDPIGTRYNVILMGNDGRELSTQFDIEGLTATFDVSEANQKYFGRVQAIAKDENSEHNTPYLESYSYTSPLAPQEVVVTPGPDQFEVTWSNASNGVTNASETEYRLTWAGGFAGPIQWNSGVKLEAKPLFPNTDYALTLTALRDPQGGFEADASSLIASTVTLAQVPQNLAYELFTTSASVRWNRRSNPLDTVYRIDVNTEETFSASGLYKEATAEEADVTRLTPNTTYYTWLRAKNRRGIWTDPVSVWSAKATDAAMPEITEFALYTTSGSVTWKPNKNPEGTIYRVVLANDETFVGGVTTYNKFAQEGDGATITFETPGLTPNLPYFARVEVYGHNGKPAIFSAISEEGVTTPADVDIVSVEPVQGSEGELKVTWDTKGNSPRTKYVVDLATETLFSPVAATTTTVAGARDFQFDGSKGLVSNQKYFARVKAENGNYSGSKSTFTWPSFPASLGVTPLNLLEDPTHQIKFVWEHGKNAANTQYVVSLSTGNHLIGPNKITSPGDTSVSFDQVDGVIWANQKYNAQVKALYAGGGGWVGVPQSTVSFTAPMAPISVEIPAGQISSTTLTIQWEDPIDGEVRNSPDSSILLSWRGASLVGTQTFLQTNTYSKVLDRLSPNTTYYIDVVTLPQIEGPWVRSPISLVGLTNPAKAKLTFGNVTPHQSSMTIHLDGNGNGPHTVYRVDFRDLSTKKDPEDKTYSTEHTKSVSPPILLPARLYQVGVVVVGHSGKLVPMGENEKITQTTLPVSPVIIAVDKLDGDSVLGQKLALTWGPGNNGEFARYETRASVTNRWMESDMGVFRATYTGFMPNTLVELDVRASLSGSESEFFSYASTQVWTRAQVPGVSQITDPLSNQSLGIRLQTGQNPSITKFAVRLATADSDTLPHDYEYADLVEPGTPGEAIFNSNDPVWRTREEWESSHGLKLSSLPLTGAYSIEIYAQNVLGQVEGPGGGLRVQQSVGEPVLTLETLKGTVMNHESHVNRVYYNHFPVPIRATNSSHFNVVWSTRDVPVNGNNIVASHGWNGAIGTESDPCLPGSTGFNYKFDGPIQGFCGEEGVYYLNIVGTALVSSQTHGKDLLQDGEGNIILKSTTSFRVFVDSTPPRPTQLEAFFVEGSTDTKLSQNTTYGDPDPYFSWSITDTLGDGSSRSLVVGWTYSVSSDTAVYPDTSMTTANFLPFREEPGVTIDLTEITQTTTFYFKVRGVDEAGNWTPDAQVQSFRYKYTPDQILPRWNRVSLSGKRYPEIDDSLRYAAVDSTDKTIRVEFSEEMIFANQAIQLSLVRGPDGQRVETRKDLAPMVQSAVVVNSTGAFLMPFVSATELLPGSAYRFFASSRPAPTDNANNALENKLNILFYTAMDPAIPAVFVSEDDVARVEVSPYALGAEPAGLAINDRPDAVSVAGSPALPGILEKANGAMSRGPGGAYRNLFAAKELSVFSTSGDLRTQAYAGAVNLVFSYEKWPVDPTGRMVGTSVRPKDLAIYELDEQTGVWNKMPNSQVDETRKVVTTSLRHNATYGLMGTPNYDLSEAHPFPVPYRPSQNAEGITFTGLSSYGTIKVFTLDGRHVKTLTFDNVSFVRWNPVQSDSGDPVGSDVYLYMIENDQQRVVGKLMVIR